MRAAKRAASGVGVTTVGARSVRTPGVAVGGIAVGGIAVGAVVAVGTTAGVASLHATTNKNTLRESKPNFQKKRIAIPTSKSFVLIRAYARYG